MSFENGKYSTYTKNLIFITQINPNFKIFLKSIICKILGFWRGVQESIYNFLNRDMAYLVTYLERQTLSKYKVSSR